LTFGACLKVTFAAGLRDGPGDEQDRVFNISVVFQRDLLQAMRPTSKEIEMAVDSSILRNGSVRKTIRQTTRR